MSTTVTVQRVVNLKTTECYKCGVIFGMPEEMFGYRLNDHQSFFCPNGHCQSFIGKSEAEKLRERLEAEQRKLANAQFEIMAAEKKVKRLEKRIKNGVCPCCHRQFIQLTRHMKTKHPDYAETPA